MSDRPVLVRNVTSQPIYWPLEPEGSDLVLPNRTLEIGVTGLSPAQHDFLRCAVDRGWLVVEPDAPIVWH